MDFFSRIPDVYVGVNNQTLFYEESNLTYTKVKNFFRTCKIRKDYEKYITIFEPYYIPSDMRPDNVAQLIYGDMALDWVILMTNNILDIYTQWPKNFEELNRYVKELYGEDNVVATHHWETLEVKDSEGNIILPSGLVVEEDFTFRNYKDGVIVPPAECKASISNFEYEEFLNEKKRFIYIMNSEYVDNFVREFEELVAYEPYQEMEGLDAPRTVLNQIGAYAEMPSGRSIYPSFGVSSNFAAAAAATQAFLEETT